jgi:phosphatidylglycerophosphatase A
MNRIWLWLATFFGIGYIPLAPGTWASMVVMATLLLLPVGMVTLPIYLLALGIVVVVGIPAAYRAERHFGRHDPHLCVIDEVAGQMVALLLLPQRAGYYIAAFFLFRFFDIFKPFPVRQSERLPGGFGIMTDDLLAGGYAWLALYLIRLFWH